MHSGDKIAPERRAALFQTPPQSVVNGAFHRRAGRRQQQSRLIAERQTHAAVGGTDRPGPDPHHLPSSAQLVEVGRPVAAHTRCEHVDFQHRRGDSGTLKLRHHLGERIHVAPFTADALPPGQKPRKRRRLDRLYLAAQRRKAAATNAPQHVGVAVLPLCPAGAELAMEQTAAACQLSQPGRCAGRADSKPSGYVGGSERPVGAGVTDTEIAERVVHRLGGRPGQAQRQRHADRVAQPRRVRGVCYNAASGETHLDGPPLGSQLPHPSRHDPSRTALVCTTLVCASKL